MHADIAAQASRGDRNEIGPQVFYWFIDPQQMAFQCGAWWGLVSIQLWTWRSFHRTTCTACTAQLAVKYDQVAVKCHASFSAHVCNSFVLAANTVPSGLSSVSGPNSVRPFKGKRSSYTNNLNAWGKNECTIFDNYSIDVSANLRKISRNWTHFLNICLINDMKLCTIVEEKDTVTVRIPYNNVSYIFSLSRPWLVRRAPTVGDIEGRRMENDVHLVTCYLPTSVMLVFDQVMFGHCHFLLFFPKNGQWTWLLCFIRWKRACSSGPNMESSYPSSLSFDTCTKFSSGFIHGLPTNTEYVGLCHTTLTFCPSSLLWWTSWLIFLS